MDYYQEEIESIETGSQDSVIVDDSSSTGNDSFLYPVSLNRDFVIDDDDYSLNTEDEYEFERIFLDESPYFYQDKVSGRYYLGLCSLLTMDCTQYIVANSVSVNTFLNNSYLTVLRYLWYHSIIRVRRPNIEIIQLIILEDGTYSAIIKTFWLRIVQRRWKKIYRERQDILNKRKIIKNIKYREIRGNYPLGLNVLPNIYSMKII